MSTYTQIYYHIVFSTKLRAPVLNRLDDREKMLRYMWGVATGQNCHLYRINAVEDHVHLLTSLHPTVCLSDFVKNLKVATTVWIKENGLFRNFSGWQDGYGAFTCGHSDKDDVIEYIKTQVEHHKRVSFVDEYRAMLKAAGIAFDEKYLN
ncbi:MAG: IS200/IS605 family transposase [Candidatus Sumerlaeaceae bacterium]